MSTLNSKQIKEGSKAKEDNGEGLYVRGTTDRKYSHQSMNNCKKLTCYVKKDDQLSFGGSFYNSSEVMMVISIEALLDWIMDSGGSYHITPKLDLFFDFLECDGGRVLLGDNTECNIKVTASQFRCRNAHYSRSDRLFRLMGPSQVESLGAFGKFKEWKHLVENQTGRMVKKMRTDNGLELCNQEFEQLCTEINGKSVQMPLDGHFKFSLKDFMFRDRDVERMSKGNANVGLVYGTDRGNHKAKLQHVMALSTTKAESIALAEAMKEAIWLRGLLEELGVEILKEKTDEVLKAGTKHNGVDALTKVVHGLKLQHCFELLSVGIG
ncbi:retrovirus-related pol polyprotein from transposon TNT 1-94 [Tanacetum coccineum]